MKRFIGTVWNWLRGHRFTSGALAGGLAGAVAGALVVALLPAAGVEPPIGRPLVILSSEDDSAGKQREELVQQWNATHRQQAKIMQLPASADKAHAAMVQHAQSGDEPVDIYNLDVTWIAEFAAAGYIVPFPGEVDRSAFLDKPLRTCEYDGKLWGLPFNTDAGLLYYRDDLGVKPPRSLTEVRNAVGDVRGRPAAQRPGVEAGYVGQFDDYEGLTVNAMEVIWAFGGEVVDRDNRVTLRSEEAAAGLRWLANGRAEAGPIPLVLTGSPEPDETRSAETFAAGKTVFMRNWPVAYRTVFPDGAEKPRVPFGVAVLPGGPSVLGGQNLAVSSRSARPQAARELIEFLTSERSQQILFERGAFAATRRIVYLDPLIRERYPYAETLRESIESARSRPVTPRYDTFTKAFQKIVREVLDTRREISDDDVRSLEAALRDR